VPSTPSWLPLVSVPVYRGWASEQAQPCLGRALPEPCALSLVFSSLGAEARGSADRTPQAPPATPRRRARRTSQARPRRPSSWEHPPLALLYKLQGASVPTSLAERGGALPEPWAGSLRTPYPRNDASLSPRARSSRGISHRSKQGRQGIAALVQSEHLYHPHRDDLVDLNRRLEYYLLLFERAAVEAHAESTLTLQPTAGRS
jgi:hypothetical protein